MFVLRKTQESHYHNIRATLGYHFSLCYDFEHRHLYSAALRLASQNIWHFSFDLWTKEQGTAFKYVKRGICVKDGTWLHHIEVCYLYNRLSTDMYDICPVFFFFLLQSSLVPVLSSLTDQAGHEELILGVVFAMDNKDHLAFHKVQLRLAFWQSKELKPVQIRRLRVVLVTYHGQKLDVNEKLTPYSYLLSNNDSFVFKILPSIQNKKHIKKIPFIGKNIKQLVNQKLRLCNKRMWKNVHSVKLLVNGFFNIQIKIANWIRWKWIAVICSCKLKTVQI